MKFFLSINEAAQELNVNASYLRFLEKEFPQLKPYTTGRGSRRYTAEDMELLRRIIYLTKECGYTLEGARQQLKEARRQQVEGTKSELDERMLLVNNLTQIRKFLVELKESL